MIASSLTDFILEILPATGEELLYNVLMMLALLK